MKVSLISTYELGRQPFGLASPAAWLAELGASVSVQDLAVDDFDLVSIAEADLVAFYVPMHTATRMAAPLVPRVRAVNPRAHICFFGLYAPLNEAYLRELGADSILGGEFEEALGQLYGRLERTGPWGEDLPVISLSKLKFRVPDRSGLPPLSSYARLRMGNGVERTVGYTEATRGCKHLCRHCPIVPVYNGKFRVVQQDVVLEDVRRQVAAGAEHITFGDPDFFNGPAHSLRIVRRLHDEFPDLTYDATIKVQHLIDNIGLIPELLATGCAFVTSAAESFEAQILEILDKRHSVEDFRRVVERLREVGLPLNPTFVAFTPWTTVEGYARFLNAILDYDLVDNVASIQYAIRLLIPEGSGLLELREVRDLVSAYDNEALAYPWTHPDPRVDRLQEDVLAAVTEAATQEKGRRETFWQVWEIARATIPHDLARPLDALTLADVRDSVTVPYLTEPWYC